MRRLAGLALCLGAIAGPSQTQNAVANGDTRTLTLFHAHTQENITIAFRRDGAYDRAALDKLNWFLRDWRREEPTQMDPRLFDVVWATHREVGSSAAIRVVSAYRSPETNNMLRRRSSAVAKHSQHTMGKAMDLHMPDVSMAKVREIGMRLQHGGVGYYPSAGTPFVHLDVGSVRSWPRMPRPQLERLFPDGKTVHLPADGTPLAGYETALAEIQSRGGSAFSYAEITAPRRSLWAALFGGEDDEVEVATPRRGARGAASRTAQRPAPQQVAAYAPSDNASVYAIGAAPAPAAPAPAAPAARTVVAPRPQPVEEPAPEAARPTAVAALSQPKAAEDEPRRIPSLAAANVPTPPRRPSDLAAATLLAANVPVPPIRPTLLASAEPPVAAPEQTASISAARVAAEPPPKPVSMPLPPARPTTLVAFAPQPEGVNRTALPAAITGGGAALPAAATAYAPARVPAPPVRPAADKRPPAPATPQEARREADALAALIAGVQGGAGKTVRARVLDDKAAPSLGASAGFTAGKVARPMGQGFVRQGD